MHTSIDTTTVLLISWIGGVVFVLLFLSQAGLVLSNLSLTLLLACPIENIISSVLITSVLTWFWISSARPLHIVAMRFASCFLPYFTNEIVFLLIIFEYLLSFQLFVYFLSFDPDAAWIVIIAMLAKSLPSTVSCYCECG